MRICRKHKDKTGSNNLRNEHQRRVASYSNHRMSGGCTALWSIEATAGGFIVSVMYVSLENWWMANKRQFYKDSQYNSAGLIPKPDV